MCCQSYFPQSYLTCFCLGLSNFLTIPLSNTTSLCSSLTARYQVRHPQETSKDVFFYVSLTVHFSITLANDQLDAPIFLIHLLQSSTCTCFEHIPCSFSGGKIVLIQHLVSSLSVSDRPVHRLRKN